MSELSQHCIVVPADLRSSKRIVPSINNLLDRRLEPVLLRVEELVVEAAPLDRRQSSACYGYTWEAAAHVERVVEQVKAGVRAVSHDPVDDGLRKGLSAGSGVQTRLRLSRALRASDLQRVSARSESLSVGLTIR